MSAFGADLTIIPSEGGLASKKMFLEMIETAREISRKTRTYWTD